MTQRITDPLTTIRSHLKEVDRLLLQQRPPHEFSRPPRAIATHLSYWKAQEFKAWLLFYSIPVLSQFLPALYFHHFSLLVCSMHILLQESISRAQIDAAEEMINNFYLLAPELYGDTFCRPNMHALSHLCDYVRWWGPLWTHSSFGFESLNGHLHRLFHGRAQVIDQMGFSIEVELIQRQMQHKMIEQQPSMRRFFDMLKPNAAQAPRANMTSIDISTYTVGGTYSTTLTIEERETFGRCLAPDAIPETVEVFSRLFYRGTLYHSTSYNRNKGKRNSCVCCFTLTDSTERRYGVLSSFFRTDSLIVAFVNAFTTVPTTLQDHVGPPCRPILERYADLNFINAFFTLVSKHDFEYIAIPVCQIVSKCVLVDVPSFIQPVL